jgi:hypothetical protein
MHPLFHVVYATHANGTHHKLALDALRHLKCTDSDCWQRVFLAHARLYLEGAEAPDAEFKDFQNHVLHTRDGFWGGAPDKVRSWYHHVVEALGVEDWPTAVYCAGVLSHYFMDPLQPFHTAQSEAENNIHRAAEWSIAKSYGALYDLGLTRFGDMRVEPGSDPNWLVELVCRGAERANGHYEKLIAHYHIGRGVVDPPAGLDPVARHLVAEMIRFSYLSYAGVLSRAIDESGVFAPDVGLTGATLLAAVQTPARALARHRANAEARRAIERMYDELLATGTVEKHLPEDDRLVRDLYAQQVLAARTPRPQASQVFPFRPRERVVTRVDRLREERSEDARLASAEIIPLRRPLAPLQPASATVPVAAAGAYAANVAREPTLFHVPSEPSHAGAPQRIGPGGRPERMAPRPHEPERPGEAAPATGGDAVPHEACHSQLTLDHKVADSPSIGARMAKRLSRHGIATVRDLVKADPAALAVRLNARNLSAQAICDWQDQALLACTVPGPTGTHVTLLVGAGYRSADAIAEAEAEKLAADVLAFAVTAAGRRILRKGSVPDIERIKGWLEAARGTRRRGSDPSPPSLGILLRSKTRGV